MKKVMDRQTDFNNKIVIATICRLALAALIIANAPGCSNSDNFAGRQPMAEPPPNTATLPNQAAYSANPQGQYPQANYKYSPRNQQQQSNYYQGSNNNNDRRTYPNYQAARQASANQSPNYPQNQGQSYNPNHYSGTPQQNPNRTTSPANYNSQSAQYQQHPVNPSAPNQANYPAGIASNPSDISWQQVPRRPVTAGPNRASRPSQSPVVSNVSIAQNDGPQQNLPNYQSSGNFNAANSNNLPIQQNASRNGTLAQNPTNIPAANQISYSDNNLDKNVLRQQAADPSTLTITPSSQTLTVPPANQTPPTDLTQPALFVQKMPTAISRNNITDTLAALKHFVATHPENTNAVLALHYLYRCQNQTEQARQSLPQTTEQANQALKAITELETLLADKADLDIVNFKVCDKVLGFGQYQEIAPQLLSLSQERQIQIYCEVQNFKSIQNSQGNFYTDLHAEISLFDENYQILARLSADVPDKPTAKPRQDFFLVGPLRIPTLSPGKYQITIRMTDKTAQKVARPRHIFFEVKPKPQSPSSP